MAKKDVLKDVIISVAKAAISSQSPFLGPLVLNRTIGEDDLVAGLLKLVDLRHLNLDASALAKLDADDLAEAVLSGKVGKAISDAIRLAQRDAGGALKVDGLLGKITLNSLFTARRCDGQLERPTPSNAAKASAEAKNLPSFEYVYFIEELPRATFDTKRALVGCFLNWQRVCGVVFTETKNSKRANVVVKLADIDGRGNTLADAHIGPPDGYKLELRIDTAEVWDEQKFEAAITHEIGHLIGLQHTGTPNQIMNAHVGTLTKPQSEDIELAQEMWDESRFQKRTKPLSGPL